MTGIWQDLRFGCRTLRNSPAFAAVAVLTLALGIGANTAIFTILNAVLIRALPVDRPERLVLLQYTEKGRNPYRQGSSGMGNTSLPYATFEELNKGSKSLSGVFAFVPLGFNNQSVTLNTGGDPVMAGGEMVSGGYFSTLGVSAILGRTIRDEDFQPGAPSVAVLSYRYWSRQFGGERSAVGRNIAVNGAPFTIVGVAPPQFFGVSPALPPDIWVPLREIPGIYPWGVQPKGGRLDLTDKGWWWCMMMGRLAPGVTPQQARAELDVIFHRSITAGVKETARPEEMPHVKLVPASHGLDVLRRRYSEPLRILMAAVGMVLLIACANVATLLLARAGSRQKEMAVRLAMGAGRARVIRQVLTESLLLAVAGGMLGVLLAQWGSRVLVLFMWGRAGRVVGLDLRPDPAVLAFSAAVSMLTGIFFGLAPAFRATRVNPAADLKQGARVAGGRFTLGRALVAGQVAFSVILLFGAGLFVRSLQKLESQELGFDRNNLLLFALDPRIDGYKGERLVARYNEITEKLRATPGVRSVTASAYALLSGWVNSGPGAADGPPLPPGSPNLVHWNIVGADFLETMKMRMVLGRGIEQRDLGSDRRVAVINEAMARRFFAGENPLGRHFALGRRFDPANAFEIVGVAHDAKFDSMRGEVPLTAYVPYSTVPSMLGKLYFELRTPGDPMAVLPAVRGAVHSVDPSLALMDIKTQADQIEEALGQEQMFARLCSLFGALALTLVAIGVYGTLAYAVTRRTPEIGIRSALGARRGQVLWMVLRESAAVVACGLLAGLPVAFALTRYVSSMLFGVKPYDAVALAAAVLTLAIVGAAAGFLPAHRASRIDPMVALRYE